MASDVRFALAMLACVAMTGCANAPRAAELSGTRWTLVDGVAAMSADAPITLAFEDGRVVGSGGCNQYSGSYTQSGDALDVGPVAATKRGCFGDIGVAETQYFQALDGVTSVRVDGDTLVLSGDKGELRFRRDGA